MNEPTRRFRHPRNVPCPVCGQPSGSPCLLRSGKPMEDIHCTDRLSAAAGTQPLTQPSEPYIPKSEHHDAAPESHPAHRPTQSLAKDAPPNPPVGAEPAGEANQRVLPTSQPPTRLPTRRRPLPSIDAAPNRSRALPDPPPSEPSSPTLF